MLNLNNARKNGKIFWRKGYYCDLRKHFGNRCSGARCNGNLHLGKKTRRIQKVGIENKTEKELNEHTANETNDVGNIHTIIVVKENAEYKARKKGSGIHTDDGSAVGNKRGKQFRQQRNRAGKHGTRKSAQNENGHKGETDFG